MSAEKSVMEVTRGINKLPAQDRMCFHGPNAAHK